MANIFVPEFPDCLRDAVRTVIEVVSTNEAWWVQRLEWRRPLVPS